MNRAFSERIRQSAWRAGPLFFLMACASCRTLPIYDPTLEPLPLAAPFGACIVEGKQVVCGSDRCEATGAGMHACPRGRVCSVLPSGLTTPTILCQQAPDDPAPAPGTEERDPAEAGANDEIGTFKTECTASVLAKVLIRRQGTKRLKETHNLAHGFSEVVVPFGFDAIADFKPGPDHTGPYTGTLTGTWHIQGVPNPYTGTVSGNQAALAKGWQRTNGTETFNPGANRPVSQQHSIVAHWKGDSGVECDMEPQADFLMTFAGPVPDPPQLDLRDFVRTWQQQNFGPGPGTRVFNGEPRWRNGFVVVPLGIYWVPNPNCCDVVNPRRKVVQFARAAIHGPNGRLAKDWSLDILPAQMSKAPNHNPSYSGHPGSDDDETPTPDGAGGTRADGTNVLQWDAPGMPEDLYDRLFAAQGASTYRQQFFSILVCRSRGGTAARRVPHYLANAKVRHVAVVTVRWDFPGQAAAVQPNPQRRGEPVIAVTMSQMDGRCVPLRAFLEANGLLDAFTNPSDDARALKILPKKTYDKVSKDVSDWERNPSVQFPP